MLFKVGMSDIGPLPSYELDESSLTIYALTERTHQRRAPDTRLTGHADQAHARPSSEAPCFLIRARSNFTATHAGHLATVAFGAVKFIDSIIISLVFRYQGLFHAHVILTFSRFGL